MTKMMMTALAVMMTGCNYESAWELRVMQLPMSALPECGQDIKTGRVSGVVVSASVDRTVTTTKIDLMDAGVDLVDVLNYFRIEVDSQEVFREGDWVRWSNGQGKIIKATRLQLYGATGSM